MLLLSYSSLRPSFQNFWGVSLVTGPLYSVQFEAIWIVCTGHCCQCTRSDPLALRRCFSVHPPFHVEGDVSSCNYALCVLAWDLHLLYGSPHSIVTPGLSITSSLPGTSLCQLPRARLSVMADSEESPLFPRTEVMLGHPGRAAKPIDRCFLSPWWSFPPGRSGKAHYYSATRRGRRQSLMTNSASSLQHSENYSLHPIEADTILQSEAGRECSRGHRAF